MHADDMCRARPWRETRWASLLNARHLLFAISGHGFGHVAQVPPVINALRARHPHWRITVRSAAPVSQLQQRIEGPFDLQATADDFGMTQTTALDIDVAASAARYRELHAHWPRRVGTVADELAAARPDLILADVPYLTLAAAARLSIPAVALCSLHWAAIYRHYCGAQPEAAEIEAQMLEAYRSAHVFLRPAPSMLMPELPNARAIGPLASPGRRRRAEIDAIAGSADVRLVLIAMGGLTYRLPMENWPPMPGVRFVVQRDWDIRRDDVIEMESLGLSFADLLASCDLFLTKPGYGAFAEAAATGVPVLFVDRPGWPETSALVEWLLARGGAMKIDRDTLERGAIGDGLESLLSSARPTPIAPTGIHEVVSCLEGLLS